MSEIRMLIKKKWFDMILSGEKKDEYREIKPYYTTRILHALQLRTCGDVADGFRALRHALACGMDKRPVYIRLKNGYAKDAPELLAKCTVSIGTGREEWGAEPGVEYYRFHILKIIEYRTR